MAIPHSLRVSPDLARFVVKVPDDEVRTQNKYACGKVDEEQVHDLVQPGFAEQETDRPDNRTTRAPT